MFDLEPAAREMSRVVSAVRESELDHPTPCAEWTVKDLLTHIHQFAAAFTANADKTVAAIPEGLTADWRHVIPDRLSCLAAAWSVESAWQGRVLAGGVEMSAAENAVVAVEELTVHGWDLACATGRALTVDDTTLDQVDRFLDLFSTDGGEGPFGPRAAVPEGASRLDRIIAGTGRDPRWRGMA